MPKKFKYNLHEAVVPKSAPGMPVVIIGRGHFEDNAGTYNQYHCEWWVGGENYNQWMYEEALESPGKKTGF